MIDSEDKEELSEYISEARMEFLVKELVPELIVKYKLDVWDLYFLGVKLTEFVIFNEFISDMSSVEERKLMLNNIVDPWFERLK